eukprot:2725615-Pyramimonas_sp.AAC.1
MACFKYRIVEELDGVVVVRGDHEARAAQPVRARCNTPLVRCNTPRSNTLSTPALVGVTPLHGLEATAGAVHGVDVCAVRPVRPDAHDGEPHHAGAGRQDRVAQVVLHL